MPDKEAIRGLTGIRGVAAVTIVLYHFTIVWHEPATRYWTGFGPGYLAVDFFFVLSGFVMGLNYGSWFERGSNFAVYGKFMWRRFSRIYPLYFTLLLSAIVLQRLHLIKGWTKAPALISNLLLVQTSGIAAVDSRLGRSTISPAWSISTEMFAYLLFPVLVTVAAARGAWVRALAAAVSICALELVTVCGGGARGPLDVVDPATAWPVVRCISEFTLGLCAWAVWRSRASRAPKRIDLSLLVLAAIPALAYLPGLDLCIALTFPVAVYLVAVQRLAASRLLGWAPIFLLGEWSFALYLLHPFSAQFLNRLAIYFAAHGSPLPRLLAMAILLTADIAGAALLFTVLERPARNALRRLSSRRQPEPIAVEPSAP